MNGRLGACGDDCWAWDDVWSGVKLYNGAPACGICGLYPGCGYIPINGCWAYIPAITKILTEIQLNWKEFRMNEWKNWIECAQYLTDIFFHKSMWLFIYGS